MADLAYAMARKIGEARKILDAFWSRDGTANPYDRDTAWAMHVAMVQLTELLRKGAKQ